MKFASSVLVLSLISAQAGAIEIRPLEAKNPTHAAVKILPMDGERVRFEQCSGLAPNQTCHNFGRKDGYTFAQFAKGVENLERQANKDMWIDTSIVVGSVAAGILIAYFRPLPPPGEPNLRGLERITLGGLYGMVGFGAGSSAVVARKILNVDAQGAADDLSLLARAAKAAPNEPIYLPMSAYELTRSLSYAFAMMEQ